MKPYERRVQRGAALLDEKKPGWWDGGDRKKINLKTLDLGSPFKCVLGQLWGTRAGEPGYGRAIQRLNPSGADKTLYDQGFALPGDSDAHWTVLTRRWREEIERRRA